MGSCRMLRGYPRLGERPSWDQVWKNLVNSPWVRTIYYSQTRESNPSENFLETHFVPLWVSQMHKLHVILQTHTITVWTFLILFYRQPVTAAFYSAAAGHDCPPTVHRKKHNDIGYERTPNIILKVKKNRWSLYSPAILHWFLNTQASQ